MITNSVLAGIVFAYGMMILWKIKDLEEKIDKLIKEQREQNNGNKN